MDTVAEVDKADKATKIIVCYLTISVVVLTDSCILEVASKYLVLHLIYNTTDQYIRLYKINF